MAPAEIPWKTAAKDCLEVVLISDRSGRATLSLEGFSGALFHSLSSPQLQAAHFGSSSAQAVEEKPPLCKPCMHSGHATDSGNNIWAQGNICSTPEPPALGHCVTALAAALPEPLLSRRLPGPPPALGIEGTVSFHPPKPCAAVTSTGTLCPPLITGCTAPAKACGGTGFVLKVCLRAVPN